MEMTPETVLGVIALAGAGVSWVISVEKRINGLKQLQAKVTRVEGVVERVDRRTERLSWTLRGRDVLHDEEVTT